MGKLGKKARKFAKKNLQSVEKRNRKLKPFFKKKFAKSKFFFLFVFRISFVGLFYDHRDCLLVVFVVFIFGLPCSNLMVLERKWCL